MTLIRAEALFEGEAVGAGGAGIDSVAMADDYDLIRDHVAASCRASPTSTGACGARTSGRHVLRVPPVHLLLQTVRSHDQCNTTIYGLDDRYRGVKGGRRVVFVNPADLAELGGADGASVDLVSR